MSVLQDLDALSLPTPIQEIENKSWAERGVRVYIKRDDLIHPLICGNKWKNLDIEDAQEPGKMQEHWHFADQTVTFLECFTLILDCIKAMLVNLTLVGVGGMAQLSFVQRQCARELSCH